MRWMVDPESAMVISTPHPSSSRAVEQQPRWPSGGRRSSSSLKQVTPEVVAARSPHPLELQTISVHWQRALDAAQARLGRRRRLVDRA